MKEDQEEPMVPLRDLEAAWRVGAGHMRRADAAEKALRDIGWEYVGADMAGEPDSASLRLWGSIPKDKAKFRRRKAGPWEAMTGD